MHSASRFTQISALALGIAGALAFGQADASGFQLRENSVKNLGRANAGTAVADDDASVVANNPAAMVNLTQTTVQADVTSIDLTAKFSGGATTALGTPVSGGNGGDPGNATGVPAIAVVVPFDRFRLGASVSAPFGLKTEYDADWVGRYNAIKSDVKTVDFTVSGAFAVTDRFSIGASVIWQRTDVTLSNAIDFGTALCAGSGDITNCFNPAFPFHPQGADGVVKVKGDASDTGWIVGLQWRPTDNFSIGYSHHSKIDHNLTGDASFSFSNPAVPGFFSAMGITAYNNGPIVADLETPEIDTLSAKWVLNDAVRLMADVQRTGWSSLEQVAIYRDNGAPLGPAEAFDWKDTTYVSLGGEWDVSDALTLRAGIAKDQTPTKDETRTPRLPDNDRMLYSIGLTWHASEALSIDAAYQLINIDHPKIDVVSSSGSRLTGEFTGHADLFGVAMQYRF